MGRQLVTVALDGEITNYPYDHCTMVFSADLLTDTPNTKVADQEEIPTMTQLRVVKTRFKIEPSKAYGGERCWLGIRAGLGERWRVGGAAPERRGVATDVTGRP